MVTLYTSVAALAVTLGVVVPAWPFYNKHPVTWQNSPSIYDTADASSGPITVEVPEHKKGGCC